MTTKMITEEINTSFGMFILVTPSKNFTIGINATSKIKSLTGLFIELIFFFYLFQRN